MKALAITSKGIENIAALEIKELINAKTEAKKGCVIFEAKKPEDLCLLCYKAQSVDKILFLFDFFKIEDNEKFFDNLNNKIKKINFSDWLDKKLTFRVSCKKINNDIPTEKICEKAGSFIIENIKKNKKYKQKVDLSYPNIIFFVYVLENDCYLGIDFSGTELNKREYKIFIHPSSLKATIAYALVRISSYNEKEVLLDPFTGSGTIPIETALFASKFPVNYYRKNDFSFLNFKIFKKLDFNKFFNKINKQIKKTKTKICGYDSILGYITNAKKNAKIAGINKQLNLSRIEVEWLDTKFHKGTVDKIVTNPPQLSRHVNQKDVEKVYNELFHQAEFILKKKGEVIIISRNTALLKQCAKKYNFKVKEEREVYSGKEIFKIVVFCKSS